PLPPLPGEPRQGIGGGEGEEEGDDHHRGPGQGGVPEPAQEEGLLEQEPQVLQGRRQVEDERVVLDVVQIGRLLEAGDRHPDEGEGQERGEDEEHPPAQDPCGEPAHHTTSARWATRSMSQATSARMGTRKTEMAAPSARSEPRMPVKKASEGRTWVES